MMSEAAPTRCAWAGSEGIYLDYHDREWGRPVVDDTRLFEKLCLEGFQAGLSWRLILGRREAFRHAFSNFDPQVLAAWSDEDIGRLLLDASIIRNRQKLEATRGNARAYLRLQEESGGFPAWLWSFVSDEPVVGNWQLQSEVPARTPLSDQVSKAMKKAGFRFVGSVTVYSYLQAAGLVQDHITGCFRHAELQSG